VEVLQFPTSVWGIRTILQSKGTRHLFRDRPCCVRTPTHSHIPSTFNLSYILPSSQELHMAELNSKCAKNLDYPVLRLSCNNTRRLLLQTSEPTEIRIEAS